MGEQKQSIGRWRAKAIRGLKWAGLLGGGLFLLFVLGIGLVALPDLTREVPTPEAVNQVGKESVSGKNGALTHNDFLVNDQNTTRTDLLTGMPIYPVNPEEMLMPDLLDFPKELLEKRRTINDDYTSVTRQILALRRETPGLTYEETKKRIDAIGRGVFKVNSIIYKQYVKEREKSDHRDTDPLFIATHAALKKEVNLITIVWDLTFENAVRHERWAECAAYCELEQRERWPEAIYYWRRQGGVEGYWHIVGGAIALRIKDRPLLKPILRVLPYQSLPLLDSDWRYVWLEPIAKRLRRSN